MSAVRHIVLFVVQKQATTEQVRDAVAALRSLGADPGVLEWRIELTRDLRKGQVIVENALFTDQAALTAFRRSPAHQVVADVLAGLADWVVGDYLEDPSAVAVAAAATGYAALD